MTALTVRTAKEESEQTCAIDTIVLAFANDPMARWCWADPHVYLSAMPVFARAFGGRAFEHDAAYCTEEFAAASLWLPPGVGPDEEAMGEIIEQTAPPAVRNHMPFIFEQMARYHPKEPHWYLPLIGVDPARQGRGYGSALLSAALAICDRDHLPAYLESSNPRNIPLYQRHGFEILGTVQAGNSPELVPMLRPPR